MASTTYGTGDRPVQHASGAATVEGLAAPPSGGPAGTINTEPADAPNAAAGAGTGPARPAGTTARPRPTGIPGFPPQQSAHLTELVDGAASDLWNGKRLFRRYGHLLRFVTEPGTPGKGRWLVWDGACWAADQGFRVEALAKETVQAFGWAVQRRGAIPKPGRRKVMVAWAGKSQQGAALRSMVQQLRSEFHVTEDGAVVDPIAIGADALDQHPEIINCANGMLVVDPDAREVVLRAHDPRLLLTRAVPHRYDPDADYGGLESRFCDMMGGCVEYVEFLQRLAGLTLTGLQTEKILPLLLGPKDTGKSTILEWLRVVLGPAYSGVLPFESLLRHESNFRQIRADIAGLAGLRFVTATEGDELSVLDTKVIKRLTGGDKIAERKLYENFKEFMPQVTIYLATNAMPVIPGEDDPMWSRLVVIPFERQFARDETVKREILGQAEAGFAWAVEGLRKYLRDGLGVPREFERLKQHQREERGLWAFVRSEYCDTRDATVQCDVDLLYCAYRVWGRLGGERSLITKTKLSVELGKMKFAKGSTGEKRTRVGVTLTPRGLAAARAEQQRLMAGDGGAAAE